MSQVDERIRAAVHDWYEANNEGGCIHFDKGYGLYRLCDDPDQDVPIRALSVIVAAPPRGGTRGGALPMTRDTDLERRYREMFGTDPFRPRDEWDADVHPESLRGQALILMDKTAGTAALVYATVARLPWYRRPPARVLLALVWAGVRVKSWLRSSR